MKTILEIKDLKKSFGSNNVLKDFSYEFKEKTIYALMGANGSGKTTLFNLLSGFLQSDDGKILFKNRAIEKLKPVQISNIGLSRTFQEMRLIPTLSVYDNILLALKNKKSEKLINAFLPQSFEENMNIKLKVIKVLDELTDKVAMDIIVHTRKMNEKFIELNSYFARTIYGKGEVLL